MQAEEASLDTNNGSRVDQMQSNLSVPDPVEVFPRIELKLPVIPERTNKGAFFEEIDCISGDCQSDQAPNEAVLSPDTNNFVTVTGRTQSSFNPSNDRRSRL